MSRSRHSFRSVSMCHGTAIPFISFLLYRCTFKWLIVSIVHVETETCVRISNALASHIYTYISLIGWCHSLNWYSKEQQQQQQLHHQPSQTIEEWRAFCTLLFDLITKVNWRAKCRSDQVRKIYTFIWLTANWKITVNKLRKFCIANVNVYSMISSCGE